MALAKCDQDIVDTKRLGLLQKPGPGASAGVRKRGGGSGYRRAVEWSGVGRVSLRLYSGKLTAVRGAARAPPDSSLFNTRQRTCKVDQVIKC